MKKEKNKTTNKANTNFGQKSHMKGLLIGILVTSIVILTWFVITVTVFLTALLIPRTTDEVIAAGTIFSTLSGLVASGALIAWIVLVSISLAKVGKEKAIKAKPYRIVFGLLLGGVIVTTLFNMIVMILIACGVTVGTEFERAANVIIGIIGSFHTAATVASIVMSLVFKHQITIHSK